jgi:hypothetical protein
MGAMPSTLCRRVRFAQRMGELATGFALVRTLAIRGMVRIGRPSVDSNLRIVTAKLNSALRSVMTCFTQRLQLASHERCPISLVWDDVVDHGSRSDDPFVHTQCTQWMFE